MKRELILFQTYGEKRIQHSDFKDSKFIICGICGNMTPEESYLANECPHCFGGILCEDCDEGCEDIYDCVRKK